MNTYFYSASINAFYPTELRESYEENGSWPDDAVEVDLSMYQEFAADAAPEGKMRIAGDDGMPAWGDVPPPTHEELVSQAMQKKQFILSGCANMIAPLQDAVDLGMATSEEEMQLTEWKSYRVNITRINPENAPDIDWPPPPIQP